MATGLSKAYIPQFKGAEYVEGYEDVSVDPEDFEGQTVLILGESHVPDTDKVDSHYNIHDIVDHYGEVWQCFTQCWN